MLDPEEGPKAIRMTEEPEIQIIIRGEPVDICQDAVANMPNSQGFIYRRRISLLLGDAILELDEQRAFNQIWDHIMNIKR